MINSLGKRRLLTISVLGFICFVSFLMMYSAFLNVSNQKKTLQGLNRELSTVQERLSIIGFDAGVLEERKGFWDYLRRKGFADPQDRLKAREVIEQTRRDTNTYNVNFTIGEQETLYVEGLEETGELLVRSPVYMTLDVLHDGRGYAFLSKLNDAFPGFLIFKRIEVERLRAFDEQAALELKSIEKLRLVRFEANFDWYSLVPETMGFEEVTPG